MTTAATTATATENIINEFVMTIEKDKEYTLKELKDALTTAFNNKKSNKKAKKEPKQAAKDKKEHKEEKIEKTKKAPSAYNIFVKETMAKLRAEDPAFPANELMKKAGAMWKELSAEEKEAYKNK